MYNPQYPSIRMCMYRVAKKKKEKKNCKYFYGIVMKC